MFLHMEHIIKYNPQKLVVTDNICCFLRVAAHASHPYKQQRVKLCFVVVVVHLTLRLIWLYLLLAHYLFTFKCILIKGSKQP
jgi:hypothetical protein